jgi:hypothetical protein
MTPDDIRAMSDTDLLDWIERNNPSIEVVRMSECAGDEWEVVTKSGRGGSGKTLREALRKAIARTK